MAPGAWSKEYESLSESDSSTLTKVCTKCGRGYPATLECFYREKAGKYGLRSRCKTCTAAYHAERRDDKAVYDADYYAEHRDAKAAYAAAYNAEHRDEKAAYDAAHNAAYYAAHRDEWAAYGAVYCAEHHEEHAAYERNRRARKLGNGGTHTAADVRAQYDRQRGRCYWCGVKVAWRKKHVDHVMPVILGGSNGPENLVIACPTCNLSKGGMHPMDFCGRLL